MKRRAKLFLQIDGEGLLTDTLAILADVVNFDCYESVVSSSQRVIAAFKNTPTDNVDLSRIFYYKRRARSSRMNPVRIHNTTDVFRAVAEHPDGEIPLGVQWKLINEATPEPVVKIEPLSPTENESLDGEDRTSPTEQNGSNSELKEKEKDPDYEPTSKRRKRDSNQPPYKTYMPPASPNNPVPLNAGNKAVNTQTPLMIGQKYAVDPKANPQKWNVTQEKRTSATPPPDIAPKPRGTYETKQDRYMSIPQYQWPDGSQCEIVVSYGGISERQALPVSLAGSILNMVRDHFSANPISKLRSDAKRNATDTRAHTVLEEMNSTIKEKIEDSKRERPPIKYLQDAKMEIFKVLSLLNLSKSRFDNLLDWLKSLKLQEGKQGKYFLSERGRVGGGLKIQYDTDEAAATKLNQIYRARSKPNEGKVLYPVEMLSSVGNTTKSQEPVAGQPIMFLMPGVSSATMPKTAINPSTMTFIPQQGVSLVSSDTTPHMVSMPHIVPPQQMVPTQPTITSNNIPNNNILSSSNQTPEPEQPVHKKPKKKGPAILRRKLRAPVPKPSENVSIPEKAPDPVPMHLYRSYTTGDEIENANLLSYNNESTPFIKTEPASFSDNEDNRADEGSAYSSTKDPGDGSNKYESIKKMLRSDAVLPQGSDHGDKQFEYVMVKSEPLDDY